MNGIVMRSILLGYIGDAAMLIPANLKHSFLDFPSTRATAKDAVKVSPAPVVSRTFSAVMIGCLIGSSPSTNKADPLAPSFTRICLTP